MCLVAVAYQASSRYALILAANRDERHSRPSAAADWWTDRATVLGGRDLSAGGSWLAVSRAGRLAAVTNFADPAREPAARSRGRLVADFVAGQDSLVDFSRRLQLEQSSYAGFNLLLFDGTELKYLSNRAEPRPLARGVHSVSNQHLDADWPKLGLAVACVEQVLELEDPTEALLEFLSTRVPADDPAAHYRSSPFVAGDEYGTRASSVILIEHTGRVKFAERGFDAAGRATSTRRFEYSLSSGLQAREPVA